MIPPSDPKGNGTEQEESAASPQKEADVNTVRPPMTEGDLRKLMADAETLCGQLYELRKEPRFNRLCVNWADFGCIETMWCRNESGIEWPVARFAEASSDGNETATHFIRDGLIAKGHGSVEIRFEW